MPPLAESPANSAARLRVTEVIARFDARAIDVCTAADRVALHFATPQGIVIVRAPLREFVQKCRAARDYHLNRIPNPSDYVRADESAAALPPPESPLADLRAAQNEKYARAWAFLTQHLHLSRRQVARLQGVNDKGFEAWIQKHHPRELTVLRRDAGLPLRVLRNDPPPPTDGRAPLLKPAGKLL